MFRPDFCVAAQPVANPFLASGRKTKSGSRVFRINVINIRALRPRPTCPCSTEGKHQRRKQAGYTDSSIEWGACHGLQ
jgi:hypothetical protein